MSGNGGSDDESQASKGSRPTTVVTNSKDSRQDEPSTIANNSGSSDTVRCVANLRDKKSKDRINQ